MILAATIGSLVGAWVLYGIAAAIGPDRFHRFIDRYGRWFRLTGADIAKAERWFDKRAVVGVLLGRCVPLVRSLVSIPAGFRRMRFGAFTVYTAVGSLIWNTALIGAGYLMRENWHDVEPVLDWFQYVVIAAILGAMSWFVWSRFLSPSARERESELESVSAD
jgi:membrane protein DedA with SNARE-associated domain